MAETTTKFPSGSTILHRKKTAILYFMRRVLPILKDILETPRKLLFVISIKITTRLILAYFGSGINPLDDADSHY